MAALGSLMAFGMVGGFFLLFAGLIYWTSYAQPKQWGETWARTAAELGLSLEPYSSHHNHGLFYNRAPSFKQRMRGVRGGLNVTNGVRIVVTGSGKNRRTTYYTYVCVSLPQALGLGLRVGRKSGIGRLWSKVAGPSDIQIGDEAIDPLYEIHGRDPEHVALFLRTPYVSEALVALADSSFKLSIEDHMVTLEVRRRELGTAVLAPTVDSAVELAQRLIAARREMGDSPYDERVRDVMQQVGSLLNLEMEPSKSGVRGRVEGAHVEASAGMEATRRVTNFVARFDRPMGLSLALTKQTTMGKIGAFLGGQDIETGDEAFDDRFVIKGSPEAAVIAALNPEVRRRLSEMQDTTEELRVEDDMIVARVGYPMLDAEKLQQGLFAMANVANAMARVVPKKIGPFRS